MALTTVLLIYGNPIEHGEILTFFAFLQYPYRVVLIEVEIPFSFGISQHALDKPSFLPQEGRCCLDEQI